MKTFLFYTLSSMFKEFKKFAMRGNVIDMAIGIIIGTAFGKIVNSLVSDVIMPPIGLVLNRVDFSNLYINLTEIQYHSLSEAQKAGAPTINYGLFLNALINFLIISFVVFLLIRQINKLQTSIGLKAETRSTRKCPHCFSLVHKKATRCPFCTSDIVLEPVKN